jgi:catechol 2,3-dioxygenase-like lactoylglutathione lyase family enzyme
MSKTAGFTIKKMSPQFLVSDLGRSIEFYTKELGFDLDFRYEDFYAGIIKDGFSIHLKSGNPFPEERKIRRMHEDLDLIFSVGEIKEFYKEMQARTLDIIQPLREMPYGKEFYISDPDGYVLGFLEA